jgi:hypothetical protein
MTLFRALNTIGNDTCSIVLFFFRTYAGQGMMKFRCTLGEHPRYGTREHRESCLSKILLGYERFRSLMCLVIDLCAIRGSGMIVERLSTLILANGGSA